MLGEDLPKRKNWLFSWTELGARHVGIVQSLLATYRLHDINPYDYFVNVLQRVGQHPASMVHQLTPRIWKQMLAPTRCDLIYMILPGDVRSPTDDRLHELYGIRWLYSSSSASPCCAPLAAHSSRSRISQ